MSENLKKCLDGHVKAGRLTREQAEHAYSYVKDLELENAGAAGPDQISAAALYLAAERMKQAAEKEIQQTTLQILATTRALNDVNSHKKGIAAGIGALLARDPFGSAGYSSIEGRYKAVLGSLHAIFADGLDAYRTKVLGFSQDKIGLQRFVRELYGENSGDPVARAAAEAWGKATDNAVARFNGAGGDIPRKEDWRLPQIFDDAKIKAAGRDAFVDYMHAALASGKLKIVDFDTGGPASIMKATAIINKAYERIESGGMVDLEPGQFVGQGKLANRRQDPRAFQWANADAWLEANQRFGVGDSQIYSLLTGHLDGIARDIAQLEILGPNPEHTIRYLIDAAKKDGTGPLRIYHLEALWDHVSGKAASPVSETVANWGRGIRSWLSSAQLGSAVLSSVTDFSSLSATALWNGIPAGQTMTRYLSLLDPSNDADRKLAVRLGLVADGWAQRAAGATRHQAEIVGNGLAERISETVMRASGLNAHTQAGRWAMGMEILGHLADQVDLPFAKLDTGLQRSFNAYGITPADWEIVRSKGLHDFGEGASFIWPEKIAKGGGRPEVEASSKILELVNREMDYAIPTPGAFERTLMLGKSKPGTIAGEFLRSSMQYKAFPVTMMTMHLMRGLDGYAAGDKGAYLIGTAIGTTMLGALAMQLKAVAQGKDPRDMKDPKFWGAAFAQGGGAGVLGDFLYSSVTRADRSFYMTMIGGPTAGFIDDLAKLTGANINQAAEHKDTHFGGELARFIRMNTPGSSLWYTRLATDRLIFDQLTKALDPMAGNTFSRLQEKAQKDYHQRFWWRPGQTAPERGPDLNAIGGPQ